ncbi:MAG: hypothetical protein KIT72_15330 [Polyangiaceae bacterium]|nr:hypothetical protein [Polyangiaceae bacterium]MCW5791787.1 hypothetical protein [Polyangiaceae bacterium]
MSNTAAGQATAGNFSPAALGDPAFADAVLATPALGDPAALDDAAALDDFVVR